MVTPGVFVDVVNPGEYSVSSHWWQTYDDDVLAPRAALEGVIAARRGSRAVGSVAGIALYDLADHLLGTTSSWPQATGASAYDIQSTSYRQLISTFPEPYAPPDSQVLHAAFFECDPADYDEFNDWYNTEHLKFIDHVEGYLNCRRFIAVDDSSKYLALYDVTTLAVAESDDVVRATASPWSDRVRAKLATYRERRVFTLDRVVFGASLQSRVEGTQ